jgi:hypothetical protein
LRPSIMAGQTASDFFSVCLMQNNGHRVIVIARNNQ